MPWDPTTPGICDCWFDATTLAGITTGTPIVTWVPRFGASSYTLTGTATYRLNMSTIGGTFPGLEFNGSSDALQVSGPDFSAPYTIAVVGSALSGQPAALPFCDSRSGGPDTGGEIAAYVTPNQYAPQAGIWELSGVAADYAQQRLLIVVFDTASTRMYVDDFKVPGMGYAGNKVLHFGQLGRDWFGNHLSGYICEYSLHNGPFTDADAANYYAYAHTKWGVPPLGTSGVPLGPLVVTSYETGFGPGVTGTANLACGPLAVTASGTVTAVGATASAAVSLGPLTVKAVTSSAAVLIGPLAIVAIAGRTGPGAWPVPGYRGRWRLTLHQRAFTPATLAQTMIAEISDARARQLVQAWNTPAVLTFTLDGHSQAAGLIAELEHDVVAWRWDDQTGAEFAVFRGVVAQSADTIDQQSHSVTYTCHDYAAMLGRRILTSTYSVAGRDQDLIVGDLLARASTPTASAGTSFAPAAFLPLSLLAVNPAGVLRGLSGQLRDRTYYGSQNLGTAIDDLAHVINGYDYDVAPSAVDDHDSLRVFYPQQGVVRTDIALQYGSTVAALTRTVDSSLYANYVRVLGNNQSANPTPQMYAEAYDATAVASTPTVGVWMLGDDAADVTVQLALNEKAAGDLYLNAVLTPAYTLTMSPGAYSWGSPNMGDTVPVVVRSGRLDDRYAVRVLGVTYLIGDDGQEDVNLTVSRPITSIAKMFAALERHLDALTRR